MTVLEKVSIIAKMVETTPNIGKTAIMKCLYLLQTIKKVPLEHHFEIYTYGPYSSEIMDEIDYANQSGYLDVSSVSYPSGQFGYSISCSDKGKALLKSSSIVSKYSLDVQEIMTEFGEKTASDLELLSTLIFVSYVYKIHEKEQICDLVKKIKPKFTLSKIEEEFVFLLNKSYL